MHVYIYIFFLIAYFFSNEEINIMHVVEEVGVCFVVYMSIFLKVDGGRGKG